MASPDVCPHCYGAIQNDRRKKSTTLERVGCCVHCALFFGLGGHPWGGTTNWQPDAARARLEELRRDGFGMVLFSGHFGDGNIRISVEAGDILKIERAGATGDNESPDCSAARTKATFSAAVKIGPSELILWPHEIAAISFAKIMELRTLGQIEDSYVAAEDECGYFRPTKEMRKQIYERFGLGERPIEEIT